MHLPVGLEPSLAQRQVELLVSLVVLGDGIARIPAINHVINRPGELDAQLARHR